MHYFQFPTKQKRYEAKKKVVALQIEYLKC